MIMFPLIHFIHYLLQILEAADKINATEMKKHALNIIVQNFSDVSLYLSFNKLIINTTSRLTKLEWIFCLI